MNLSKEGVKIRNLGCKKYLQKWCRKGVNIRKIGVGTKRGVKLRKKGVDFRKNGAENLGVSLRKKWCRFKYYPWL